MSALGNIRFDSSTDSKFTPQGNYRQLFLEYTINRILYANENPHELNIVYENLNYEKFPVFNPNFKQILALLRIDYNIAESANARLKRITQSKNFISMLFKEVSNENFTIVSDIKQANIIVAIFSHGDISAINKAANSITFELYPRIAKYLNNHVSIAMSSIKDSLFPDMFLQTKAMLNMRFIQGNSRLYIFNEDKMSNKLKIPEKKVALLCQCILTRNINQIRQILEDIFEIDSSDNMSITYFKFMHLSIINTIIKTYADFDISINPALWDQLISDSTFEKFDNHIDIVNHLCNILYDVYKEIDVIALNGKDIVYRVKDYILRNYKEEFRLTHVSKTFAIHPNYLSTLFHSHVGKTLVAFLTEVRIQNACQLLKETNNQIKEIAQEVGYNDIPYFYKVFKKITGITPLDFRNSILAYKRQEKSNLLAQ